MTCHHAAHVMAGCTCYDRLPLLTLVWPSVCRNPGGKNDAFREISDAYEVRPAFCRFIEALFLACMLLS